MKEVIRDFETFDLLNMIILIDHENAHQMWVLIVLIIFLAILYLLMILIKICCSTCQKTEKVK